MGWPEWEAVQLPQVPHDDGEAQRQHGVGGGGQPDHAPRGEASALEAGRAAGAVGRAHRQDELCGPSARRAGVCR